MAWYLVHLTVIAAAAACAAATTCPKSGITQPGVITLAIDLTSENTIDIVTDTCNETPISAIPSDTDGELEIDAGSKGIVSVESYRPVQNLCVHRRLVARKSESLILAFTGSYGEIRSHRSKRMARR